MSYTPLHDKLDAQVATLPDDAIVTMPVRTARALVDEAAAIEDHVITAWMDAITR